MSRPKLLVGMKECQAMQHESALGQYKLGLSIPKNATKSIVATPHLKL
ncbi:MAG: hypothetical protein OXE77_11015 [Flavobacteriaceae bacterium]|nr:hypothetical protein [Flavobacteriaceae bacterium]